MRRRPPTPADPTRPSLLRLYLTPSEIEALDKRASKERHTRAAQVSVELEAWLAAPGPLLTVPASDAIAASAKLGGALLARVERLVGVEMRTRAVEAAVRGAGEAAKKP